MNAGQIRYAVQQQQLWLELSGALNYSLGQVFNHLLDEQFAQANFRNVIIDLTHAISIDSTLLGLLARIANFVRGELHATPHILSTSADIHATLESVGFDDIFSIQAESCPPVQHWQILPEHLLDESILTTTIYKAHKCLADLNEKNQEEFAPVVHIMEQNLKSSPSASSTSA